MIELEIDGKTLEAEPGETIIQVADKAGIYIPRYCYHGKLSVVASCRMCLVDVEKAPKTLPACATPVTAGMKVCTRSEKALQSQKTVMEFLLINHPLDCPICDQGGECELQDLAMGYGSGLSRYNEPKRAVHDENLGPLIASEMTRCIQCTRCVRFGQEIAGMRELGAMGSGEDLEISTYVPHAVKSELSGNMIDLCPVGALTSKPYRFSARAWELRQHAAIAPHDCLGSNIYIHTRSQEYTPARQVMRVVSRENEAINEVWISDRDRFSYEGINSAERLQIPLIKNKNGYVEAEWDAALAKAQKALQQIIEKYSAEQIGVLISPSATLEEHYLLQKLMRSLGCTNIDYRLQQTDFRHVSQWPSYPALNFPLVDLEKKQTILLIGSNIRFEQPLAAHRIRKGVKQGTSVFCVNPVDYDLKFAVEQKCIVGAENFVHTLAKILKAMLKDKTLSAELSESLADIEEPSKTEIAIAEKLLSGQSAAILLGAYAIQHPDASIIYYLSQKIAALSQGDFSVFTEGANSAGASLAEKIFLKENQNEEMSRRDHTVEMFEKPLRAYVLLGVEPELDTACPAAALQALKQAELVISLTAFSSLVMENYTDILLPISTFAETSGTYINVEGKWQSMVAATLPQAEARPGWQVLSQLATLFNLPASTYASSEAVLDEIKLAAAQIASEENIQEGKMPLCKKENFLQSRSDGLYRIAQTPMYRIDPLVRHAASLQATLDSNIAAARINTKLARRLDLTDVKLVTVQQYPSTLCLPLVIDDTIADNQVWIPMGLDQTAGFGAAFGEITLKAENERRNLHEDKEENLEPTRLQNIERRKE